MEAKGFIAEFPYLGKRDFVHSTTITDSLIEALASWRLSVDQLQRIDALFHRPLTQHGCFRLLDDNETQTTYLTTVFRIVHGNSRYSIGLEGNGIPVTKSVPYDEDGLIREITLDPESKSAASTDFVKDRHLLRVIVSTTKRLHYALFPTEGYSRWYVARYDLDWSLVGRPDPGCVEVGLLRSVQDLQTRSKVLVDSHEAGFMYFARKALNG